MEGGGSETPDTTVELKVHCIVSIGMMCIGMISIGIMVVVIPVDKIVRPGRWV